MPAGPRQPEPRRELPAVAARVDRTVSEPPAMPRSMARTRALVAAVLTEALPEGLRPGPLGVSEATRSPEQMEGPEALQELLAVQETRARAVVEDLAIRRSLRSQPPEATAVTTTIEAAVAAEAPG